jgi:hypothetical protein
LCVHVCVLCLGEVNELFPGDGTWLEFPVCCNKKVFQSVHYVNTL